MESKNRGSQAFDLGEIAVENSEVPKNPPQAPPPFKSIIEPNTTKAEDLVEPGETLVTTVHRHPIGLIVYFIEALLAVGAALALAVVLIPSLDSGNTKSAYGMVVAAGLLLLAIMGFIMVVVVHVYRKSQLLVTDASLIQNLQKTLFNKKISRLSMSNVEDVNAEHRGLLQTLFNYGTLTIETAGEQDNFVFPYCPNPNKYADMILEARQRYAKTHQG